MKRVAIVGEWFSPAPRNVRLIDSVGTKRLSVAGTSGAGKTYAVMRLCELLHERQSPFVVLDTVGNFWGLRVAKDGKSPGLSIPVLGGVHADLELDPASGGLIAEFLHKTRASLVVDLSMMDEEERSVFVTGFAKRLLGLWKQKRQVLTVIVDEAQDIIPEILAVKGDKAMRGAMHTLGLQGRNFGIGMCLVTQAPQNVLKRLFNLADLLIAGRLGGEHERNAVVRWVKQKGLGKDALDELAELPTGTLYAWSPSWLEFFGKVRTTDRWTLDSSRTPELGDVELEQGALAPVDLDRLGKALRALSVAKVSEVEGPSMADESEELVELRSRLASFEGENGSLWAKVARLEAGVARARAVLVSAIEELDRGESPPAVVEDPVVRYRRTSGPSGVILGEGDPSGITLGEGDPSGITKTRPAVAKPKGGSVAGLEKADRAILTELAWQRGAIPKRRLALLAGYSARGGGFSNALGRRRKAGHVVGSGELEITAEGRKAIGSVRQPPRGGLALYAWWLEHRRVDKPMRAALEALHQAPEGLSHSELAEAAGYKARTGGFSNAVGRLRTLGLVVGKGREPIRLASELS